MNNPIKLNKLYVVVNDYQVVDPNLFAFQSKADANKYKKDNWGNEPGIEVKSLAEILDCV